MSSISALNIQSSNYDILAASAQTARNGIFYEATIGGIPAAYSTSTNYAVSAQVLTGGYCYSASAACNAGAWSANSGKFTKLSQVIWTISDTSITSLYAGLTLVVKIPSYGGTSSNNATMLNINSSGAKQIRYNNGNYTTHYGTGTLINMTYDGTYFQIGDRTDGNTDTKVTQSNTTTTNYRPIILGYTNNTAASALSSTQTNTVYVNTGLYYKSSNSLLVNNGPVSLGAGNQIYESNVFIGSNNSGTQNIVIGHNNSGVSLTSLGTYNSGNTGLCIGTHNSAKQNNYLIGEYLTAASNLSNAIVVGRYNADVGNDSIFVVASGIESDEKHSNVLAVKGQGRLWLRSLDTAYYNKIGSVSDETITVPSLPTDNGILISNGGVISSSPVSITSLSGVSGSANAASAWISSNGSNVIASAKSGKAASAWISTNGTNTMNSAKSGAAASAWIATNSSGLSYLNVAKQTANSNTFGTYGLPFIYGSGNSGVQGVTVGLLNFASADSNKSNYAIAIGSNNSSLNGIAFGYNNTADNSYDIAIGLANRAGFASNNSGGGDGAVAIGYGNISFNKSQREGTIAFGYSNSSYYGSYGSFNIGGLNISTGAAFDLGYNNFNSNDATNKSGGFNTLIGNSNSAYSGWDNYLIGNGQLIGDANNTNSSNYCFMIGNSNINYNSNNNFIIGNNNYISGDTGGTVLIGTNLSVSTKHNGTPPVIIGYYNHSYTADKYPIFIIGNGGGLIAGTTSSRHTTNVLAVKGQGCLYLKSIDPNEYTHSAYGPGPNATTAINSGILFTSGGIIQSAPRSYICGTFHDSIDNKDLDLFYNTKVDYADKATSSLGVKYAISTDNYNTPICFADPKASASFTASQTFYDKVSYHPTLLYNPYTFTLSAININAASIISASNYYASGTMYAIGQIFTSGCVLASGAMFNSATIINTVTGTSASTLSGYLTAGKNPSVVFSSNNGGTYCHGLLGWTYFNNPVGANTNIGNNGSWFYFVAQDGDSTNAGVIANTFSSNNIYTNAISGNAIEANYFTSTARYTSSNSDWSACYTSNAMVWFLSSSAQSADISLKTLSSYRLNRPFSINVSNYHGTTSCKTIRFLNDLGVSVGIYKNNLSTGISAGSNDTIIIGGSGTYSGTRHADICLYKYNNDYMLLTTMY